MGNFMKSYHVSLVYRSNKGVFVLVFSAFEQHHADAGSYIIIMILSIR